MQTYKTHTCAFFPLMLFFGQSPATQDSPGQSAGPCQAHRLSLATGTQLTHLCNNDDIIFPR